MYRFSPSPSDVLCFSTEASDYGVPELIARAQKAGLLVELIPANVVGYCEVKIVTPQTTGPGVSVSGVSDPVQAANLAALHSLLFVHGWDLGDGDTATWFGLYLDAMIAARDSDTAKYETALAAMEALHPEQFYPDVFDFA